MAGVIAWALPAIAIAAKMTRAAARIEYRMCAAFPAGRILSAHSMAPCNSAPGLCRTTAENYAVFASNATPNLLVVTPAKAGAQFIGSPPSRG